MQIAVLDIGSRQISVLLGKYGINNCVVIDGCCECDYSGFLDGQFLQPDELHRVFAEAIRGACKDEMPEKITVGLPGEFCTTVVRDVQMSLGRRRKILEQDITEMHNNGELKISMIDCTTINIQAITYMLDGTSRTLNPEGMIAQSFAGRISYTLCPNSIVQLIESVLKSIGIKEVEYCSSVLAESLFLFDDVQRDKGIVLIDCGYLTTSVAIIKGDGLLAHYSFSAGGAHISADINMHMNVPYDIAEILKQEIKLSLSFKEDDNYEIRKDHIIYRYNAVIVNAIATERIRAIGSTVFQALSNHHKTQNFDVYVTGGGISFMRGAKDILCKVLGRQINTIAPSLQYYNLPHQSSMLGLLSTVLKSQESNFVATTSHKGFFSKLSGK